MTGIRVTQAAMIVSPATRVVILIVIQDVMTVNPAIVTVTFVITVMELVTISVRVLILLTVVLTVRENVIYVMVTVRLVTVRVMTVIVATVRV